MLGAGILGPAIYRLVYQPILDKPRYVLLVASVGFVIAMEDGFRLIFGPYGEPFNVGSSSTSRLNCDTGLGVLRLADAGYETAVRAKARHRLGL